jgi:lincosamide nucleotidyltransferase A/C/D/E
VENNPPRMTAEVALHLLRLFDENHIEVIVDGGWAVDALLGEQTRPHSDLDIAMTHKHVPVLRALLESQGYWDVPRDDTRQCNFVLGDEQGHLVDIHTYSFDEQGKLIFGVPYPPDSLGGRGTILGCLVHCITPEWLVQFHTGYALDENDYHDVCLLCARFKLELPDEYSGFRSGT